MFSKFEFCGYLNLWVFKICGYSNLWVHKICDDTKFQVSGREYQNICVLCISCEQKNICAFFHICFLPYVQNIPCELGLRDGFEDIDTILQARASAEGGANRLFCFGYYRLISY